MGREATVSDFCFKGSKSKKRKNFFGGGGGARVRE